MIRGLGFVDASDDEYGRRVRFVGQEPRVTRRVHERELSDRTRDGARFEPEHEQATAGEGGEDGARHYKTLPRPGVLFATTGGVRSTAAGAGLEPSGSASSWPTKR